MISSSLIKGLIEAMLLRSLKGNMKNTFCNSYPKSESIIAEDFEDEPHQYINFIPNLNSMLISC